MDFKCVSDSGSSPTSKGGVVKEWTFAKKAVPVPGDENVRINLWLCTGHPPVDANEAEAVISKFEFIPPKGGDRSAQLVPAGRLKITSVPPASLVPGAIGTGTISGRSP